MNIITGSMRLLAALSMAVLSLLSVAAKEHTVIFTAAQGNPDGKITFCETGDFSVTQAITKKDPNGFIELKVAAKGSSLMHDGQIDLHYGSTTKHSKITVTKLIEEASVRRIRLVMRDGDDKNIEVMNQTDTEATVVPDGETWKEEYVNWRYYSISGADPQKTEISVIKSLAVIREIEVTFDDGVPIPTYKVIVGEAPNVTVTVNGGEPEEVEIEEGQEAELRITADEGYVIKSVTVNGDKYLYDGQQQVIFTRKVTENLNIAVETEAIGMGTVTIAAAEHTSISVSCDGKAVTTGSQLPTGSQLAVTVRADAGYRLTEAKIGDAAMTISDDGSSAIATHTLSGDITISSTAEERTYALTAECQEGASLTINDKQPSELGALRLGEKLTIKAIAAPDYFITAVSVNGQTTTYNGQTTASLEHIVKEDVAIRVSATPIAKGGITWTADEGASVTVTHKGAAIEQGASLPKGETIVLTVRAAEDYRLASFNVNGEDMLAQLNAGNGTMTLTVAGDMAIQATSEKYRFTATVDADSEQIEVWAGGQQLMSGRKFDKDEEVEITVKAKEGYSLSQATVEGSLMTISEDGSQATATHTVSGDFTVAATAQHRRCPITVVCPAGEATVQINGADAAADEEYGKLLKISVKASAGFFISSVAINGQASTFSAQSEATFEHTVLGAVNITVTTAAIPQGGITWTADEGVSVTVTRNGTAIDQGASLPKGETIVLTVKAAEDYRLTSFTVNGEDMLAQLNAGNGTMTLTVAGDMAIQATSEKYRFTATVEANSEQIEVLAGGQQLTSGRKFDKGEEVEITVNAKEGFSLSEAKIDDALMTISEDGSEATATHTVGGDFTVAATAQHRRCPITVVCPAGEATVQINGADAAADEEYGKLLRISVKASAGFFISSVAINGQASTFSAQSEATFEHTVAGPVNITVTTAAIPQGGITWTVDEGASVTVTRNGTAIDQGASLPKGETIVLTVRAAEDYRLTSFTVNGEDMLAQLNAGNGTMTLTVAGDMAIQATSEKYRFTATVAADSEQIEVWAEGQQLMSGRKFDKGEEVEITVKAKEGFSLSEAKIDDALMTISEDGSEATATHTVSGDFTVAATAQRRRCPITVVCPAGEATVQINGADAAADEEYGKLLKISVKASAGFFISSVAINGQTSTFSAQSEATFEHTVTGPVNITVKTAAIPQGGITWTVGTGTSVTVKHNGTAIQPGTTLPKGSTIVIEATAEEDYQLSEVMIGDSDRLADMLRAGSVTVKTEGELAISVRARKVRATATLTFDPAQAEINLANGEKVETGKEIEIRITAKDGFRLVSAIAGEQSIPLAEDRLSASGKITVTDNFTLTVRSEPIPLHKVEWSTPDNCVIEVAGVESGTSVREGTSIHVKVTPAEGYKLTAVKVNGMPQAIADEKLFETDIIVTADIVIDAEAEALPLPVYQIVCTQPEHGRIEVKGVADPAAITHGTAVTIAVTADEGYEIEQVVIDDVAQQAEGAATMEIPVTVTAAHTVSAVIAARQYPVVWESAEGATITVKSGGKELKSGDKAEFGTRLEITVTADATHRLGVVKINGDIADVTDNSSYRQTLEVSGPCTIQVWTTVSDKYPVVWSAGDNGTVEVRLAGGTPITNGATVVDGAQIEVTARPYDACKIRSVNVNNVARQITDETKPLVFKLTVDKPIVISALFYRDTYHLTVKTDDPLNGEVNVEMLRDEVTPQSDYAGDVKGGKRVRMTAVPYPGCSFGGWVQNGVSIAGSAVMTTTIEEASNFTAHFRLNTYRQHSVKFLSTDEAHGSIRLLQLDGIALDMAIRSEHIFTTARRLMVEATPTHPDAIFEGWTDEKGNAISVDRRIIYAQSDNVILRANFAMTYAVTVGKTDNGRITLTDAEGYAFEPGQKIKGQKIRITLEPDEGFMPDTLTVNGKGYAQTDMTAADNGSAYVEVTLDKATTIAAGFTAGTLGAEIIEADTQGGVYYDLNGRRLGTERPSRPGIYILIKGRKSQKIRIM